MRTVIEKYFQDEPVQYCKLCYFFLKLKRRQSDEPKPNQENSGVEKTKLEEASRLGNKDKIESRTPIRGKKLHE